MRLKWFDSRNWLFSVALAFSSVSSLVALGATSNEPTHKQARSIAPMVDGRPVKLETFCVGPDNHLWMCCAGNGNVAGLVMVYQADGELLHSYPLSFLPQAINFSPEGKLFVAGSGKVARMSTEGKVEVEIDAPNIGNKEEAIAAMKKENEKRVEQMISSSKTQLKRVEEQIAKLEEVPEDETEKAKTRRERRLKLLKVSQKQFEEMAENIKQSLAVEQDYSMGRWASATGLAATDDDVFVSLPMMTGFGYGIWRMNHELTEPKLVMDDVHGCCGQLDIQTDGENLLVAENTKFQVGFYDRDGKRLNGWGKRLRNGDEGFGSCCNPMNVRCCANGEILTAESSIGHIKRFNQAGEFLGFVGTAKVAGGCKHVAIGFDSSRNYHYMMNEDRSHVAVLVPRADAPAETEDERISREAMASHGQFIYGTWELADDKADAAGSDQDPGSMSNYIQSAFAHMEFSPDGALVKGAKGIKSKSAEPQNKGLFGALLSSVTGSQEQADLLLNSTSSKWQALQAKDSKLDLVTIDEGVQGYGATVEFLKDDTARFTFFYGEPSSPLGGSFLYKRISLEACGKDCSSSCNDGACSSDKEKASK